MPYSQTRRDGTATRRPRTGSAQSSNYSNRNNSIDRVDADRRYSSPRSNSGGSSNYSQGSSKPRDQRPSSEGLSRFSRGSRPGSRFSKGGRPQGSQRSGGKKNKKQYIDPARFIQAAKPVKIEAPYKPQHHFSEFPFDTRLQSNLRVRNYALPTPIQDQSIIPAIEGRDVLGIANTGTGKTAAFLLPLIQHALNKPQQSVIILAPTRELAIQIEKEFYGFTKGLNLRSAVIIGGAPMGPQIRAIRANPHFVIGTPGRVKDLMQQQVIRLSDYNAVVLDEVDRMLDMGFVKDITMILQGLPKERQSLFFSATLSDSIEKLIDSFLQNPVKITVKTADTSESVEQDIVRVPVGGVKIDILHDLLISEGFDKVLIFGETKRGVERLAISLTGRGFKATAIHGNKSQGQRNRAIEAFKRGEANILVATDVAARGIDIKDVSHVINFSQPQTYDDYVHRIGRTGRGGKTGKALTFID